MRMPLLALALTGALLSSGIALAQQSGGSSNSGSNSGGSLSGGANGKSAEPQPNTTTAPNQGTNEQTMPATPDTLSGGANGKQEAVPPAGTTPPPSQGTAEPTTPRVPDTMSGGANGKSEVTPPAAATPEAPAQPAAKSMQGMQMPKASRAHKRMAGGPGGCQSAALRYDRMQQRISVSAMALDQATQLRNEGMTDCNAGNTKAGLAKLMQATKSLHAGS